MGTQNWNICLTHLADNDSPSIWGWPPNHHDSRRVVGHCKKTDSRYGSIESYFQAEQKFESWWWNIIIPGSQNGGTVPYKAILWGYIPLHSPYIGLMYVRYLQFRFLKWPLNDGCLDWAQWLKATNAGCPPVPRKRCQQNTEFKRLFWIQTTGVQYASNIKHHWDIRIYQWDIWLWWLRTIRHPARSSYYIWSRKWLVVGL